MSILIKNFNLDGNRHEALITYDNEKSPIIVIVTAKSYDDKKAIIYPLEEITGKVVPMLEGEWIPIKEKLWSKNNGWEEITVEYECSRCGTRENNAWVHCHCGATMKNGRIFIPPKNTMSNKEDKL